MFDVRTDNLLENISKRNGHSFLCYYNENRTNQIVEPMISVVVPVFKEEKILANTLSVYTPELRKKYNFELIVSDGGSKDNTLNIAKEYADTIVTHNLQRKQTISEGRNNGAAIARGKTIVFINGDTVPENPDLFFDYIYRWTSKNNEINKSAALACKVNVIPEEEIFRDKIFYTFHNLYVRILNFIGLGMGRGECQIVNSDVFKKIGGYNTKIVAGEDFDLYRRISKLYKVEYINKLKVFESPRRFRKYGYLRILMSWTLNSLSVWFCGRSVSDNWEAVR